MSLTKLQRAEIIERLENSVHQLSTHQSNPNDGFEKPLWNIVSLHLKVISHADNFTPLESKYLINQAQSQIDFDTKLLEETPRQMRTPIINRIVRTEHTKFYLENL